MPNTSSAKKALRNNARRRTRNVTKKRAITSAIKQVRSLVVAGKRDEAAHLMPRAYKTLDKAAKTNVLKPNTARRMKSRLAQLVAKGTK